MAETIPVRPKRRATTAAPAIVQLPKAPKHLSAEARKRFDKYVSIWVVGEDGIPTLVLALECWDTAERLRDVLNREGETFRVGDQIRAHPAFKMRMDAIKEYRMCLRSLGLQPEE